jgi:hypothetical protein
MHSQAGMFICLGILFAGISVGAQTFGREKIVFWRDTSAGMAAIPYFLAKFLSDIPRIMLGSLMYSVALILFYPYRQLFSNLMLVIFLVYFVSYAMGYFIGIYFPLAKSSLIGTGFALLFSLVLAGEIPKLDVIRSEEGYASISWLWDTSAPRWAIEAFWLKEIQARQSGVPIVYTNTYLPEECKGWGSWVRSLCPVPLPPPPPPRSGMCLLASCSRAPIHTSTHVRLRTPQTSRLCATSC